MVFGTTHKVKSHRLGRRRKKGGNRMVVAPWIVITLVCVLVAAGLTWGFVTLLRSGCDGMFRVRSRPRRACSTRSRTPRRPGRPPSRAWTGECIGVEVRRCRPLTPRGGSPPATWDDKSFGARPDRVGPRFAGVGVVGRFERDDRRVRLERPARAGAGLLRPGRGRVESDRTDWLGGQPPTWADVTAAAQAGTINLAAANPRTSTEGLVAMLNATSDGAGGFSADAMGA